MNDASMPIILAEDDDGHADLIEINLRRAGLSNRLHRVHDGQEALDAVFGRPIGTREALGLSSFLIVLDINMPKIDGLEVLRQIKSNPATSMAPVIIFTTTDDPRDIQRCYELGCNMYITKPVAYDAFVETIQRLGHFLQVISLPKAVRR